ncbi:redox-sensing transcriptional repressor Rex [candidate division WOR-1 bacterium RIFOXYB2_FULL_42_35]|uniref:Redox-sensing transcriptional repressor Rex n=1 Tax=candidate division WOR-1 bacterium RIFOXYC2_FULL_41_25 TaxID=1802586 RepID=A0A1F4TNP3_UNCSA|nr:MAG: redox-sensing transcriptional repressor Rex [candidate division WOR-1 bacterium RIFOXYA2_FULL_41_14]OGC24674.1 MAG: redox-sensing transcriptional repressor Rex [candidate division WOR-1 bacterium RIFOXYB2_FULL_42_35]OGC34189.1 MAG: redox-sensing transcriptional repressor Rex [candidate division WOR-1 bacterium RIFOXYC2_FULL_41_25]OGC42452.1 MAG: redox-sensing transcriptional repressor Rex [candidate division WOR-1 bacterium RIFOXYD2_FULL_41_8]
MKKIIPRKTIQRLLLYYRYLLFLLQQGTKNISSTSFADILEISAAQLRKDLSYFGKFGTQGAGYDVLALRDEIAKILGIDKERKVCIVGLGNLGLALLGYKGFASLGFVVTAIFDNSPQKIGRKIKGFACYDIKELIPVVKNNKIEIALLTVPSEAAQEVARRMEDAGIKAILNFTPVKLSLSKKIKINNVDLAAELKTLSYFL